MVFHLSPYNHHWTAFITQPLSNTSNPNDLKSIFEDPSDTDMEDLPKPKCTLQLKQSFQSLKSTWMILQQQSSIMAPTVVSQPSLNDITISPIIPTDPVFPPYLQPQWPYHLGDDIMVVGRGTYFVRGGKRSSPLLDHLPGWLHRSWVLVIDHNPQDMLSWLDRVGSLMQLWWGQLSELIQDAILVTGKGDVRERWVQRRAKWNG